MNSVSSLQDAAPAEARHLVLVSHLLCPYVQRAAIVLAEKGIPFERRDVDLAAKPDWFLKISPLGKTPVLLVGGSPVFESAVICEYLDEAFPPQLHPAEPLRRAQHRSWMAFGSTVLDGIAALYNAADDAAFERRQAELRARFEQLEATLAHGDGLYFDGPSFGLVDAVFAPVFRYFDLLDEWLNPEIWKGLPRVQAWRGLLAARPSVRAAVPASYVAALRRFLMQRDSALGRRVAAASQGAAVV